jgi:hypothetical protein
MTCFLCIFRVLDLSFGLWYQVRYVDHFASFFHNWTTSPTSCSELISFAQQVAVN